MAKNNDINCLEETHGKDEFLQAVQVLFPQLRLFGTFTLKNFKAGGSAKFVHKNLLPDGAIVTHVTTCQGRDHTVTIRSGGGVMVVVNVHFERDLVLRDLRERLRLISLHWPRYPEAFGVIIGDFNICEPEKGRFTEGDTGKMAVFRSFFPHVLDIAQPSSTRKNSAADGTIRTQFSRMLVKSHSQTLQGRIPPLMVRFVFYPESTGRSLMYLLLRRVIFIAILMFLTTLENGIMSQFESSFRNRQIVATTSSEFRVGCPNIPFSALFCKRNSDVKVETDTSRTPAQHTRQLGSFALGCLNRIASLQEQTFGHTDALLCGLGTCWKMLRPMLLRVR